MSRVDFLKIVNQQGGEYFFSFLDDRLVLISGLEEKWVVYASISGRQCDTSSAELISIAEAVKWSSMFLHGVITPELNQDGVTLTMQDVTEGRWPPCHQLIH